MGLLFGLASGSDAGYAGGYALQRRYDTAYEQCMYAKGNQIPGFAPYYAPAAPPPPASVPPAPPAPKKR
jgi:hypothetical protein